MGGAESREWLRSFALISTPESIWAMALPTSTTTTPKTSSIPGNWGVCVCVCSKCLRVYAYAAGGGIASQPSRRRWA